MFNTPIEIIKAARKAHRCTYCGELIEVGSTYHRWTTYDDSAHHSKMHPECVTACAEECREYGDNEYLPYEGTRPKATEPTP